MARGFLSFLGVVLALPACDCAGDSHHDGGDDDGSIHDDGGVDGGDAGDEFDGGVFGRPCEPGDDCNDGIPCTIDSCDEERSRCKNRPDDHLCANEVRCDGEEVCDRRDGCLPGPPLSCSDEDVCTIDSCDEAAEEACIHGPRDFDGDGHADWHCKGGDDCDDTNPRVYEGATEICGDTFDNDCNGLVDADEACVPPGYDWCSDAVDVSAGGVFEVDMGGAFLDYALSCGFNFHDVALTFTLAEEKDVDITAEVDLGIATVALGDSCTDVGEEHDFGELECHQGFPGRVRRRSVAPGTYWVIVATQAANPAVVHVTFSDPTPPEPNETCDDAIDVSAGGAWEGSFVDVANDYVTSCGFSNADLVYTFTTAAPKDVVVAATADDGYQLSVAVESTCGVDATSIRCSVGAPADFRLYSLPAGTYYLIVESAYENDFTLEVSFEDPTSPPPGDTCDDPIDASAGGVFSGDLGEMQDDYDTRCGYHYREEVFQIDLDSVMDVSFESASATFTYLSIRTTCDDRATEQRCVYGDPARARFRSLTPGTYYALVESFSRVDFDLTVEISDPVPIVDVVDNDVCDDATYEIPVLDGGVFRGDTTGMGSDYSSICGFGANSPDAAFRFVLGARTHIEASLEGSSYNAVLHLHHDTCSGVDLVVGGCSDSYFGNEAFLDLDLNADTYFLVVDGYGNVSDGEYILDVSFEDL
jgi:hypothetical protein